MYKRCKCVCGEDVSCSESLKNGKISNIFIIKSIHAHYKIKFRQYRTVWSKKPNSPIYSLVTCSSLFPEQLLWIFLIDPFRKTCIWSLKTLMMYISDIFFPLCRQIDFNVEQLAWCFVKGLNRRWYDVDFDVLLTFSNTSFLLIKES